MTFIRSGRNRAQRRVSSESMGVCAWQLCLSGPGLGQASRRVRMNGAVMTSATPLGFCAQFSGAGARIGEAGGTSRSSLRPGKVSRLDHIGLKPLTKGRRSQVQAAVQSDGKQISPGALRGSKEPAKATLMVDPLEAKRLAAVEWKLLQERAAFQKKQTIEAVNGGWAVLGLTIGIILEGYTGKGILAQVAGYVDSLAQFIASITPATPGS